MTYHQHIQNYRHDYETDPRFLTRRSVHYIFHYFQESEAERDIETIVATQEAAYEKIIAFLGVAEPNRPIEYYFYPDKTTKMALTGDDWYAQSIYNEFRVHVLYTKEIKPIGPHEDMHLLSLPWGLSIGLFQEGLAEYMVGHAWDKTPHLDYVRKGYRQNLYPPLGSFMRHEAWLETDDAKAIYFYSLAGAFVTFLIKTCGKERFEDFYKASDRKKDAEANSATFTKVYDIELGEVEKAFKEQVHK